MKTAVTSMQFEIVLEEKIVHLMFSLLGVIYTGVGENKKMFFSSYERKINLFDGIFVIFPEILNS